MIARLEPLFGGATLPVLLASVLLCVTAWVYWPGIAGPELLDDRTSILILNELKDNPERALDNILGDKSGAFGRIVPMASFVIEKLYFDDGIAGNKRTNILLHCLNGLLVIWLFWLLFRHQSIPRYRYLAVALGALWLLHPLMVSTVLYAVQRMAMFATLFSLLTLLAYTHWRLVLNKGHFSTAWLILVAVFFGLGMLSKENAILVLPTLLLMEVLWFRCEGKAADPIRWLKRLSYSLITLGFIGLSAALVLGYDRLAMKFHRRPFTLDERLLTQARVVWDYVGQLLYPNVQRMGIYHDDVVVSESMASPNTTSLALIAWGAVVLSCLAMLPFRYGKLFVFGVAWFLVGHAVESTVFPLEMYFEHRNYGPSIGLMISLGALFAALTARFSLLASPLVAWMYVLVLWAAVHTSPLVIVWSSKPLLILHHHNGHPTSARANNDMAVQMALHGELDAAIEYSQAAFEGSKNKAGSNERHGDYLIRNLALSCTAGKPPPLGIIEQIGQRDVQRPLSSVSTLLTMVRLLQDDRCPHIDRVVFANRMAKIFLVDGKRRGALKIYGSLAVLENALGRYDKALAYTEVILQRSPNRKRALLMKLHFATALQQHDAVADAAKRLTALQLAGKLTVGEEQTLALYMEN
ncbi:MAG: glycosyltransferase family 39 protein [Halioglobus sp.]